MGDFWPRLPTNAAVGPHTGTNPAKSFGGGCYVLHIKSWKRSRDVKWAYAALAAVEWSSSSICGLSQERQGIPKTEAKDISGVQAAGTAISHAPAAAAAVSMARQPAANNLTPGHPTSDSGSSTSPLQGVHNHTDEQVSLLGT